MRKPRLVHPPAADRGDTGPEPRDTGTSSRKRGSLPARFVPRFWSDADRRCAVVRQVEERVEALVADCGADSTQRRLLAERAAFIAIQLETAERGAIETGKLDAGSYVQACNALLGLLKALGLEKRVAAQGLKAYVEGRA